MPSSRCESLGIHRYRQLFLHCSVVPRSLYILGHPVNTVIAELTFHFVCFLTSNGGY